MQLMLLLFLAWTDLELMLKVGILSVYVWSTNYILMVKGGLEV